MGRHDIDNDSDSGSGGSGGGGGSGLLTFDGDYAPAAWSLEVGGAHLLTVGQGAHGLGTVRGVDIFELVAGKLREADRAVIVEIDPATQAVLIQAGTPFQAHLSITGTE